MHFSLLPLLNSQDIWINVKWMWSSNTIQTFIARKASTEYKTTDKTSPRVSLHTPQLQWEPLGSSQSFNASSKSFLFSSDSLHQSICDPWRLQDWHPWPRVCLYSSMMGIYCSRISGAWNTPGWPFTSTGWPTTTTPPGIVLVAQGEPLQLQFEP